MWISQKCREYGQVLMRPNPAVPDQQVNIMTASIVKHAISCENTSCPVALCGPFKERIPEQSIKPINGFVIYSNTSCLKENHSVVSDTDYWFLCDRFLNKGSYGSVSEAVFCTEDVEAHVAVKEVENSSFWIDAKFARQLNGMRANILAPFAIIRRDGPSDKAIIIMEKAVCSLHDYVEQYHKMHGKYLELKQAVFFARQVGR